MCSFADSVVLSLSTVFGTWCTTARVLMLPPSPRESNVVTVDPTPRHHAPLSDLTHFSLPQQAFATM